MVHRHELSEAEWARIAPLLPPQQTRGTYYRDHRTVLNGMLYRHATRCQWRDLPDRYGPWSTVHSRFRRWTRGGLWDRILAALQRELDAAGRIDRRLWCIDGSHVRAHRAAGLRPPAGRGGKTAPRRAARASRPTTRWGAAAAGSPPSCTSPLTARACRSPWR
jgi:transposase